jgi:hypothetical protein
MEHARNIESLVKDISVEIIVSDEQQDENDKSVREPVLVFASDGKRIGYISISQLQKWINYVT